MKSWLGFSELLGQRQVRWHRCGQWQSKRLKRLDERRKKGEYVPAIDYARVYLRLSDKEQALRWLAKAARSK